MDQCWEEITKRFGRSPPVPLFPAAAGGAAGGRWLPRSEARALLPHEPQQLGVSLRLVL